jgi:hypothetical protein
MDATIRQKLSDDKIDGEREIIRQALDDIAQEVGNKLREAALNFPVFLTVPRSGNAIVTMATPADPQTDIWLKVVQIVSEIVSERLGSMVLQSRELPCAMVSASETMSGADLTGD